ncbi:uncharacterized protein LOC128173734 [Crassostrea angulata]|uniref:uncharacterized protein LOC128173734 n=1 Tax=Magallana angulata TaxID=2784310 RepID=UPI0022B09CE8|nr:uncharacterized protein LOC128173734 [Crassostrea angulata]
MHTDIILKQTLLIGTVMFFPVCHGQRPYPAQSDITSGSLVAAAGSIGIVALAASAALTAMSSLKISKDCYSKGTTQSPGESCNDILEEERQRCEEEKGELERTLQEAQEEALEQLERTLQEAQEEALELIGATITVHCERFAPTNNQADCIVCAELLDDETACNNNNLCQFDGNTGVCVFG